ncbi:MULTISPECIES: hypothetical protein [unclassified Wolbachia]|nr:MULTISPECIES: hypothetical protein [unclassified Wolbachia]
MAKIKIASFVNKIFLREYLLILQFQDEKPSQHLILGVGNVLVV